MPAAAKILLLVGFLDDGDDVGDSGHGLDEGMNIECAEMTSMSLARSTLLTYTPKAPSMGLVSMILS
jgi:hypothetical protein